MALYLVTGPTESVVTLDQAKEHLRLPLDEHDHDNDVQLCIDAATAHIDGAAGWLQRAVMAQTWDLKLSEWCCNPIKIPLPPLIELQSITYYDDDNALQTVADSVYEAIGIGGRGAVHVKQSQTWPTIYSRAEPVTIRFRAGYVDTENSPTSGEVPAAIKKGLLLYVGSLFAHRETVVIGQTAVQLPWAAEQLLTPYRIY